MANPAEANSDPFSDDRSFEYAVDHRVEPGARPRFLATTAQLAEAERRRPGFLAHRGPTLVREGSEELWRTRIRWRDMESWLAWMDSAERRAILQQGRDGDGFRFEGHANWQGYARWLAGAQAWRAPVWKTNLLVLLVLYPTVTVLERLLAALPLAPAGALLLSVVLSVTITGFWLVPLAGRLYGGWLEETWPPRRRRLALASIPLALALMTLLFHRL
jgi:antibiotic biosynthesis monooxygenase (ABM) superfamily enzyme